MGAHQGAQINQVDQAIQVDQVDQVDQGDQVIQVDQVDQVEIFQEVFHNLYLRADIHIGHQPLPLTKRRRNWV